MAVTLSVLENEAKVFADSLKLKELELAQLEKNHNRLQGKAEVDGRVEFESLNGIRKTQYRKGELVYTIYLKDSTLLPKVMSMKSTFSISPWVKRLKLNSAHIIILSMVLLKERLKPLWE